MLRFKFTAFEKLQDTLRKDVHKKGCERYNTCPRSCCSVDDEGNPRLNIYTAILWEMITLIDDFIEALDEIDINHDNLKEGVKKGYNICQEYIFLKNNCFSEVFEIKQKFLFIRNIMSYHREANMTYWRIIEHRALTFFELYEDCRKKVDVLHESKIMLKARKSIVDDFTYSINEDNEVSTEDVMYELLAEFV